MIRSVDTRNFNINRATDNRINELNRIASSLPEGRASRITALNSFTGSPLSLVVEDTQQPVETEGTLIDRALNHVAETSAAFGFAPEEPAEFVPDPNVIATRSGISVVHLHQTYHGIPVYQMNRSVHFSHDNKINNVVGDSINLPPGINTAPQLNVIQAVTAAVQYIADPNNTKEETDEWGQPRTPVHLNVSEYLPKKIASFSLPSQPSVFDKGPFSESITAHLILYYQNPETRLGWYIRIVMPDYVGQYEAIVTADQSDAEILLFQNLASTIRGTGNVYKENPGAANRQQILFPQNLTDYPLAQPPNLPADFPGHWCDGNKCIGNNTIATLGDSGITFEGEIQGDEVIFDPGDESGHDQKILNIFYFCNVMHDFFYMLGFDEEAGNFQAVNYRNQGIANDPVSARAHRGRIEGTANMYTPPDGQQAIMNMGLVDTTGRHTAFDADVVFHEFVHGVTGRLVGGRMNPGGLQKPQSQSMNEGYADYFALTIQNINRLNEKVVLGDWVTKKPNGIRRFKYNSDFPDHFDKIGTGRYTEEHNIGEIWCATLMEMNRNIVEALGSKEHGYQLCWQIVIDSLKLSPSNPSFLDGRDAILTALDSLHIAEKLNDADYSKVKKAIWKAFAKFGMGPNADCFGASLDGIVADFAMPANL